MITERRFDEDIRRTGEEPFVALCGFDTAASRLPLETAGFDLVVEAGLGDNLATFDRATVHMFPDARQTPGDIWDTTDQPEFNSVVLTILQKK